MFSLHATSAKDPSRDEACLPSEGKEGGVVGANSTRVNAPGSAASDQQQGLTRWVIDSITKRFGAADTMGSKAKKNGGGGGQKSTQPAGRPAWQLSPFMLRKTYNSYCSAVDTEALRLNELTPREEKMLPPSVVANRLQLALVARETNLHFFTQFLEAIPTDESFTVKPAEAADGEDKLVEILHPDGIALGTQNYASMGSIFLHLFRDWSLYCDHVTDTVYLRVVESLQKALPLDGKGSLPKVLVPGAGLGKLAHEIMSAGYQVESNEFSPLFVTATDWAFNKLEKELAVYPLAHIFSENNEPKDQYTRTTIRSPRLEAQRRWGGRTMRMTVGDFVSLYKTGGPVHQQFDAIVTCFFIDTCDDLLDYIQTLDQLLAPGGVWVNLGPLNYKNNVRLKLAWSEIEQVFEQMGYEFTQSERVHTAYHLKPGIKLYTEQYDAVLTTAIKRKTP